MTLNALRRLLAPLAAACAALTAGQAAAQEPAPRPKLILAISIDQFSANLFDDWRGRYKDGLARLSSGVAYRSGYQTHSGTETCPGHSTLLTGKHPNKTGIVANAYVDAAVGRLVYCVSDSSVVLAHDPKASPVGPARMEATALGDWLKAASPQSRVVAVSGKDRAAITMAGHKPDGVFWLFSGYGFTTYIPPGGDAAKALAPVAATNQRLAPRWKRPPQWAYQTKACRAAAGSWRIGERTFESAVPPTSYGTSEEPRAIAYQLINSPAGDEITGEAAIDLIKHYRLGRGPATDLLAVSFSATDWVGHRYGTRGPEMCEQMHRLDATVGKLLAAVDALNVPYLVVVSADHGGSDMTERLQAQGFAGRRVVAAEVMGRVNKAVMAELSLTKAPLSGSPDEVRVAPDVTPADRPRVLAAAVRALSAQPEIAAAFTRDELLATPIRKGAPADEVSLKERFAMSAHARRSPDIMAALQPLFTLDGSGPNDAVAGHGSPWNYDRRVPMLFWWPGAKAEDRFVPVETVDIAPTLAGALGLTPPADIDGRCLPLPTSSGVTCPAAP